MDRKNRHGVVEGMADDDRVHVERLLEVCNREEGLDLPIALAPTVSNGDVSTKFLFLDQGSVVGFASLPEDPEPEACVMVHPDRRRRGVGRALLDAVRAECRRRGLPGFLLVCDEGGTSAKGWVAAMGGRYRSYEYRLAVDHSSVVRPLKRHAALRLRPTGCDDAATLVRVLIASFEDDEDAARQKVERGLQESKRRYYLGELAGEPVGMLKAGEWDGAAEITSFGVLPAYRGRGFGRQLLVTAVDTLVAAGWERVLIEVATDNDAALGLYRSCGFDVVNAYGFYELTTASE